MTSRPFAELYAPQRPGNPSVAEPTRLIGIELRLIDNTKGWQREVAVIPLDIELPASYSSTGQGFSYNVTVHTNKGDSTTQGTPLPR